jgi:large subunit ribosomal protein L24
MTATRIKKGDTVAVLTGKDKGKSGKVLQVDRKEGKVVVEGVNVHHRFEKAKGNKPGQRVTFSAFMRVSNVILVCSACNKPTRIGAKILDSGEKQRICKVCGKAI